MKHTPGPWELVFDDGHEEYAVRVTDGPYFKIISTVDTGFDEPFEAQQHANAKLIAAAPDLLAGAQRAYNYMLNTQREHGIADGSDEEFETTKLLRAAIAKATA